MDVVLLGTGSPLPDPNRAGPATLVEGGGRRVLVDAGRAVLMRAAAVGVAAATLDAVLLTHLHSDHITDLSDVITTRWVTGLAPAPLTIVGPPGTGDVVDGILTTLASDIGYRIAHHEDIDRGPDVEVVEVVEGPCLSLEGMEVTAAPTDHRPVTPTVGFRIEADGTSVVVAGDTVPCAGLDDLARGAGALVHTVIRKDLVEQVPLQRFRDILDYHSSVEQAAETAARAGVGTLVLTHYVPPLTPGDEEAWRTRAAGAFPGRVELGDDLHRVSIT